MKRKYFTLKEIRDCLDNEILPRLMPINDYVKTKKHKHKVIPDSIWGQIYLAPWESAIVDMPLLQRLRQIHQLGVAFFVYPSAIHDRFTHSLGVAHLAESLVSSLQTKVKYGLIETEPEDDDLLSLKDTYTIKLAGLLHDIGHCMFSHYSEVALVPYWNHLYENELATDLPIKPATHELTGYLILTSDYFKKYWQEVIIPIFKASGVIEKNIPCLSDIAKIITGNFISPQKRYVTEIINGPYDMDKIEYLQRDATITGLAIAYDRQRYFSKITLHKQKNSKNLPIWSLVMNVDGIQAAEQVIIGKMMLSPYIYKHNTVLSSGILVSNIIAQLLEGKTTNNIRISNPIQLLLYTDYDLLCFSCSSKSRLLKRQLEALQNRVFPMVAFAFGKYLCLNDVKDKKFERNFKKIKYLAKTKNAVFRTNLANKISWEAKRENLSPITKDDVEISYSSIKSTLEKLTNAPVISYASKMGKIKDRSMMGAFDSDTLVDNELIYFYVPIPHLRVAFKAIAEYLEQNFGFIMDLDLIRDTIKLKM